MSLLEVIGPVMVGPSSSHTAGAVRLGRLARSILGEMPPLGNDGGDVDFRSLDELARQASSRGVSLGKLALTAEARRQGISEASLRRAMAKRLAVMKRAVKEGLESRPRSRSGLVGGDAWRVAEARHAGGRLDSGPCPPVDSMLAAAIARALAVAEVNAAMGVIVAAPTAGACGVLPGVLLSVAERVGANDERLLDALFAAAAVGEVIAARATLAGAEGGCQAETGSAAAMAAAAAVELCGAGAQKAVHAAALAMKGLLGLVCDPVGGLVEVPCVKRNATGAAVALAGAEMALAGVKSLIPVDEVIAAMGEIGHRLPASLRETGEGGLAVTPTAKNLCQAWLLR